MEHEIDEQPRRRGVPNFIHYILERLPDAPDGKIRWICRPEKGEKRLIKQHFDFEQLNEMAAGMVVGEKRTIFMR